MKEPDQALDDAARSTVHRARILVVEDNLLNLELMTYLLTASGHEVVAASTGGAGVEMTLTEHPDLVVLDLQLPDMHGYGVLGLLKAEPATARVPVIAVSAYAMVGDRDQAIAVGFDGYLSKPIEPATFARDVGAYLLPALRGHAPVRRWLATDRAL